MALENKTVAEINQLIIDQLEAAFNQVIPILPKNFCRVLAKIFSGVFIILYKVSQWIFLQMFVSTASFKQVEIFGKKITPLIEWGILLGVGTPFPSQQAILKTIIQVNSPGETLFSGTQFISTINGLTYITQQDYLLDSGIPYFIDVICTEGGIAGNLEVGQILSTVNTLEIIENDCEISEILQNGVDTEKEEQYRQRVVERFQLQPQGGALADYRIWSQDASGVYQTYIYTGDPPSNVLIYVAGDPELYPFRIPSAALLIDVGNVCTYVPATGLAKRKPVNAIIDPAYDESYGNVLPIIITLFQVKIYNLVADDLDYVKNLINAALFNYFFDKEPFIQGLSIPPAKNKIFQAAINGIIYDIVNVNNASFTNATLLFEYLPIESHVLGQGELVGVNDIIYEST
jgi:hypothetical protein